MRVRSTAVKSSASQQHEARVCRLKHHDQPAIGVTIPVPVPVTKKIFKGVHVTVSLSFSAAFEAASASLSAASARRPWLPETK